MATHAVLNQPPPLVDVDVTATDPALAAARRDALDAGGVVTVESVARDSIASDSVPGDSVAGDSVAGDSAMTIGGSEATAGGSEAWLAELGALAGSADILEHARLANDWPPQLRSHDRYGHRIDEIEFHPSWHVLLETAIEHGLHAAAWDPAAGPGAHARRAAGFYVWTQAESGQMCPISMTYASIPALRAEPALAAQFEPLIVAARYDPGLRPPLSKRGVLAGMSMTEKQGGSDVRSGTTTAVRDAGDPGTYRLTGHKWFTSAPMNDVFVTLAQAPAGPTCFLVPRVLPDGSHNAVLLQRLKAKLGNRSNASAEIEYDRALGFRIGVEGRGIATILKMVSATRLDCVVGSAGQLRAALSQACHHAAHRSAFGRLLADQPVMTAVLGDLAVESWASTLSALRLARCLDGDEPALLRLALPAVKFWVCKRVVPAIAEALECLGGNGYVEDSGMPRLFCEAPLNGIWEGSGNVTALDAVRAVHRAPEVAEALLAHLRTGSDGRATFETGVRELESLLLAGPAEESARRLASLIARLFAAAELIRLAPAPVADLYCATRLGWPGDRAFGELPPNFSPDLLRHLVSTVTPPV